jgi:phosphonate transport system permease protein
MQSVEQMNLFFRQRRWSSLLGFVLIVLLSLGSAWLTEFDVVRAVTSFFKALNWLFTRFYPTVESLAKLPKIGEKMAETVLMAITATMIAAVISIILAIVGSQTTRVNSFVGTISRGLASVLRNVPVIGWALILQFSFGQGMITGLLALLFGTTGYLTRAFIETIDGSSDSSVEALRASGANYLQVIRHAVLPSSLPQMMSWILYMIETNVRDATLVGILTGSGIGFLFELYYKGSYYNHASLIVIIIILVVIGIETLSNQIRRIIL